MNDAFARRFPRTRLSISICAMLLLSATRNATAQIDDYPLRFDRQQERYAVFGATNCESCHAGRVSQYTDNEKSFAYDKWRGENDDGPHFNAYKTLHSRESRWMAEKLDRFDQGGPDPTKRDDCLSCHAFAHDIPEDKQGPTYDIADGVSCEACHGRAEKWQGDHQLRRWHDASRDEWFQAGMYETRDIVRWAEKCAQCHIGSANRQMSHTLMGAGHPDLTFEFYKDLYGVPMHWREERTWRSADEGTWYNARLWAIGQAVVFRENMLQVIRAMNASTEPDFALFDCFACHHDIGDTARRRADVSLTTPGLPAWDASAWVACRHLVEVVAPESVQPFQSRIDTILRSLTLHAPKRDHVRQNATELIALADQLVTKVATLPFDPARTRAILTRLCADPEYVVATGPRGAEQIYGGLYALYINALAPSVDRSERDLQIRQAIDQLRQILFDDTGRPTPQKFDGDTVRSTLKKLHTLFEEHR